MGDRSILAKMAAALAVSGAVTFATHLLQVDALTACMIYLVAVLCLSARLGFLAGALASVFATLGFDYSFLPPTGSLRVEDADSWISLGCFLFVTTLASRLVGSARERSVEANGRQREIEALYDLCVDLFTASARPGGLDAATSQALRTIGVRSGGLVLPAEGQAEPSGWIGGAGDFELHKFLDRALPTDTSTEPAPSFGLRNVRVPVVVDGRTAGILVAYGTRARQETLESVAKLIALSFERERLLTEQARLEGLQASDSFKTSLLRAVSHDLSTPLTAMLLSLGTLDRELAQDPERRATINLVVEEATRLHRRIKDLLAMARLESGGFALQREPSPPADLFRAARENLGGIAAKRRIESRVDRECPDLDVDLACAGDPRELDRERASSLAGERTDRALRCATSRRQSRVRLVVWIAAPDSRARA
jgi:two-component system sensor histidine kinase KdpD